MGDNIRVSVRLRNLIEREVQAKAECHWIAKDKTTVCAIKNTSNSFSYDRVFDGHETNDVVYAEFCAPIVKSVINGFNGTIFAYGQTSSGKTYTLMGEKFDLGIAQQTVYDIFEHIQNMEDRVFLLRVSFMEIYNNEKVIDLLKKKSDLKKTSDLKLQDDQYGNVTVTDLTESEVQEADQVLELLRKGQSRRKTGETVLNQKSSRSHLIFQMIIESRLRGDENAAVNVSHLNIVDLAGSEKPSENASGTRFKEGVNINTSLLMLSQVIKQLSAAEENQFINYRASKLTRILKNSLGGNALTAIICTITPASLDETLSTLKFALSAKKIKNKPKVNEIETEETLIKSYANKIKKLTKQLETTKEEKDQEAKKRQDMQEQIESLKKKFVQFVPQSNISRNTRRETWGGCMDMARLKFLPNRPLKLSVLDEESETTVDGSETDKTFSGEFLKNRLSTVSNRSSTIFNRLSSVSSVDSSKVSFGATIDGQSKKEDIGVQTDCLLKENLDIELKVENEVLKYKDKITELEKKLSELKDFTTLEKQLMFDEQNSETKIMRKSLNYSSLSPVREESFGILNSLTNRGSGANQNVIDLDQDIFFSNLYKIIEKISNILNIEVVRPSITNPYFKVIYLLTNIIFQKHFITNEEQIDQQIKNMFSLLTKIFLGFSDQENSALQNSELILHFDEMAGQLLANIEKFLMNSKELIDTCPKTKDFNGNTSKTLDDEENVVNSLSIKCQCKHQISSLEETINSHLETINHLQSNHELIKKQLSLSEDKIAAQEQNIASLENEIKLKVKCCAELVDNFTQTSYMTVLNESDKESNHKLPCEVSSSEKLDCSNCLKSQNYSAETKTSDAVLSLVKSKLSDIRLLTQKMMEDAMPKGYYNDLDFNTSMDATSDDFVTSEIVVLTNMFHKIRFYLKDRSEWCVHLESQMGGKMTEISSLQRRCSSAETALQEKENQLKKLNDDLKEIRKEISQKRLSIRYLSADLMESLNCFDPDDFKLNDVTYLKKIMGSLADAIVDTHSALEKLREKYTSKENKITQTVENYPDLAALEEVRTHEFKERAQLCQNNASLTLKVNELTTKIEDLEQDLIRKDNRLSEIQNFYEKEIEENQSYYEDMKKNYKEAMERRIKSIEDKYEFELKNHEKSSSYEYEKLKSLQEEYKLLREKKQHECKELKEHYLELISQLNTKYDALKSNLESKLREEVEENEESRLKLLAEIRDYKSREETAKNAYYKLKNKFKEYVEGVKNMRMNNAKYVKEKEVQTDFENPSTEVCRECCTFKEKQKDWKAQIELKTSEMTLLDTKNKHMLNEIAALKKDLAAKSALLFTCNCRLIAKPQEMRREVSLKTKNFDSAEVMDHNQLKKKADLNPNEILKLDIVQRAINEARETERAIFNNGEGPASQEMCFLLRRKLAKKEKEIAELKNIVSQKQLKVAPVKHPLENLENKPIHPIDAEILNSFTPHIKTENKFVEDAVLKGCPKKILLDANKPQNVDVPRNKWFMTQEEAKKAKEQEERLRKFRKEPECKQQ